MTAQPALFGEKLPDLPGKAPGVVKVWADPVTGKPRTTLQCWECLELEEPEILILMQSKFITCGNVPSGRRMCKTCRHKHYRECDSFRCKEYLRDEK